MLQDYLNNLFKTAQAGDAREESFYPDLKKLLEKWVEKSEKRYSITALPKKTEGGNPDFRVWDGKSKIVGYIEAKAPDKELSVVEKTEQIKRYRETFPNFILTNFFEFRLYRNGEPVAKTFIGRPFAIYELKIVPPAEHEKEFFTLLDQFFAFSVPKTTSAKQLAIELAKRTRFLRDQVIAEAIEEEKIEGTQILEGFQQAFREHLIPSLTTQGFSDLFAQTITYGLFAARSRAENDFAREFAYKYVPQTVGILSHLFRIISSSELPKQMEWIIDDIAEVLAASNVNKIIHDFYAEGKGKDPIVHFYETFLAEYDPKEREKRGVYYTPEPVVSYITHSVHHLLKEKFSKADGFAASSVTVLDPASGTLTFPALAIHQAVEEYIVKYGKGQAGVSALIHDHILKDFYAFELMMAPYAVGHLKIGFVLDEYGYRLAEKERFKLYLTNTLDFTKEDPASFPGMVEQKIAEESREALKVKEKTPVMVVMGNPPYSGISENKGDWILQQINEYKKVDGKPLGERNSKWLQDDYVKFFRFAQWKIERAGQGILGFITNHAWLDNPTFRGMRASLLNTFDEIYIVNLRGNSLKKETTPQGEKDENVFDIRAGVAITVGVKLSKPAVQKKVFYEDQWGLREEKYEWLEKNSVASTQWEQLPAASPNYLFVPQNTEGLKEWESFSKITEVFSVNSVGVVTARDKFVIDENKQSLQVRIDMFRSGRMDDYSMELYNLKDKPSFRWYTEKAREKLQSTKNWQEHFARILYRPFDERWIYYHPTLVERSREEVMKHLIKPNLALITSRQLDKSGAEPIFVTDSIIDAHSITSATSISYTFPLYLYNDGKGQRSLFGGQEKLDLKGVQHSLRAKKDKEPNIAPAVFEALQKAFGKKPSPEEIFHYIYAVFYSNAYRNKYREFLERDFPRVPFTEDYKLFQTLADLGKQLVDLHLLRAQELEKPTVKFEGGGKGLVEKPKYDEKRKRVYINEQNYFEGVAPEAWNYYIGGYQVLHKWLKDRSGHTLSSENIQHYTRIATALTLTLAIQNQIDKLYPKVEKSLI